MNSVEELSEHLARGRLTVFYGPDLSSTLTGIPDRVTLAASLTERYNLPAGLSLAATAQRVAQGGNRWAFTDFLTRQLDSFSKQPKHVHLLLARLPVQTIITTTYDNLLERAFQQLNVPFNKFVRDSDLAFAEHNRRTLIKLYGDLEQRDTLVVTEDDHYGLWRNRDKESLLDKVRETMRDQAILFVGYAMSDPDFLLLWREVLDRAGRFAIGAYALHPDMPTSEQQMWQGRHVRVLDIEPLECLQKLAATTGDINTYSAAPTTISSTHTQHISGNAQVGAAVAGDVHGNITLNQPQGDVVQGDKVHGDKVMGDKVINYGAPRPADTSPDHIHRLIETNTRRLRLLEQRAAVFGYSVPPEVQIEIEDIRAGIARLEELLKDRP